MQKSMNKVKEIDVASVEGSSTLAETADRRAVERCKEAIEKLGVAHTPVVGATREGRRVLLSGQSELTAMRELGLGRMEAVEIGVGGDAGERAKLTLLLISLNERPGALCEGMLLQEAVDAGVPRAEIQEITGKSASWVSNRLSLVTRLDGNVRGLVRGGLLDARSAQEIARLPEGEQFAFAEMAVKNGLPKSAIESLVAGYNDESCPDAVKKQMLGDPRAALKRLMDIRRAANADKFGQRKKKTFPDDADGCIKTAKSHMSMLCGALFGLSLHETKEQLKELKEVEIGLLGLLSIVRGLLPGVSPGKTAGKPKQEGGGGAG